MKDEKWFILMQPSTGYNAAHEYNTLALCLQYVFDLQVSSDIHSPKNQAV